MKVIKVNASPESNAKWKMKDKSVNIVTTNSNDITCVDNGDQIEWAIQLTPETTAEIKSSILRQAVQSCIPNADL